MANSKSYNDHYRELDISAHDQPSTEADEIAANIIKTFGSKPKGIDAARFLVTRYMGTPSEIGYNMHDNIADALLA